MATGLRDRATVYIPNGGNGVYDVVVKENLRCKIKHISGGDTLMDRAELAAIRRLVWDFDYLMPEDCEVLIRGQRWNPQPNTMGSFRGTNGIGDYRACDVVEVRADSQ